MPSEGSYMARITTGSGALNSRYSTIVTEPFIVPSGVTYLVLDFNFLSNEAVGSYFDDRLQIQLSGDSTIISQEIIASMKSSSFVSGSGSGYGYKTGFQTVQLDVSAYAGTTEPLAMTLEILIADFGDSVVDSAGLIDNFRFE